MKLIIRLFILCYSLLPIAWGQAGFDLAEICAGRIGQSQEVIFKAIKLAGENHVVMDNGFCAEYERAEMEASTEQDRWKIRFYASHSFTTYFDSDITFRSTRYNVEIKDYQWAERSSREFFLPKTWRQEGNNPFQMIDEPTNTYTLSIERDGHEFFLSAFHPKFLQADDQFKYMRGHIDGIPVDGMGYVNEPFDGYNQRPGESELIGNVNSHLQMNFEVGYGKRFTILNSKIGTITWIPSVGIGVMMGKNHTIMTKENTWWEYDYYTEKNYRVQGAGASVANRIEFNTRNEYFGIFYENKFAYYYQKHGFLDGGTQQYNLGYMGNSLGIKFMINNPSNKKKKKKPML